MPAVGVASAYWLWHWPQATALLQPSLRGTAQGSAFTAAVARAPPPYSGFTNWVDARITLAGAVIGGADIAASVNNAAAAGEASSNKIAASGDNLGATMVGGSHDLAAGRPRWRQGGPLTTYGRFDHLRDTGS